MSVIKPRATVKGRTFNGDLDLYIKQCEELIALEDELCRNPPSYTSDALSSAVRIARAYQDVVAILRSSYR